MNRPLLSIYNGRERALGVGESRDVYLKLSVGMRKHLHLFKGAQWAVFTAIALHIDELGWSWPTVPQLSKEAGYKNDAIYTALNKLEELRIKKMRVLLRTKNPPPHYVPRDDEGKYKRNFYLIFPSDEDIAKYSDEKGAHKKKGNYIGKTGHGFSDSENRDHEKPDHEKHDHEKHDHVFQGTKNNHGLKNNHDLKKTHPPTNENQPLFTPPLVQLTPGSPNGGGGVNSKHPLKLCIEYATWKAAQPGSTIRDAEAVGRARYKDGLDDELIDEYLRRTPEQVASERRAPSEARMFYGEAAQIIHTMITAHRRDPLQVIAELPVDEEVRRLLIDKFSSPLMQGES